MSVCKEAGRRGVGKWGGSKACGLALLFASSFASDTDGAYALQVTERTLMLCKPVISMMTAKAMSWCVEPQTQPKPLCHQGDAHSRQQRLVNEA